MRHRLVEQLRQAPAGREIRDDLEPIRIRAIDSPQLDVRGVADRGEARDPLGERRYEVRVFDEVWREIKAFDLVPFFGVDPVRSRAESINCDRFRSVCHREHSDYRLQWAFREPGYGKPKQPNQLDKLHGCGFGLQPAALDLS
ncbi:hypothetical protein D3C83_17370 [compost metagenome]